MFVTRYNWHLACRHSPSKQIFDFSNLEPSKQPSFFSYLSSSPSTSISFQEVGNYQANVLLGILTYWFEITDSSNASLLAPCRWGFQVLPSNIESKRPVLCVSGVNIHTSIFNDIHQHTQRKLSYKDGDNYWCNSYKFALPFDRVYKSLNCPSAFCRFTSNLVVDCSHCRC